MSNQLTRRTVATIGGRGMGYCDCGSPVFQIVGNALVMETRHHGERHDVMIPLQEILKYVEGGRST